jgi:hypothetical protein
MWNFQHFLITALLKILMRLSPHFSGILLSWNPVKRQCRQNFVWDESKDLYQTGTPSGSHFLFPYSEDRNFMYKYDFTNIQEANTSKIVHYKVAMEDSETLSHRVCLCPSGGARQGSLRGFSWTTEALNSADRKILQIIRYFTSVESTLEAQISPKCPVTVLQFSYWNLPFLNI